MEPASNTKLNLASQEFVPGRGASVWASSTSYTTPSDSSSTAPYSGMDMISLTNECIRVGSERPPTAHRRNHPSNPYPPNMRDYPNNFTPYSQSSSTTQSSSTSQSSSSTKSNYSSNSQTSFINAKRNQREQKHQYQSHTKGRQPPARSATPAPAPVKKQQPAEVIRKYSTFCRITSELMDALENIEDQLVEKLGDRQVDYLAGGVVKFEKAARYRAIQELITNSDPLYQKLVAVVAKLEPYPYCPYTMFVFDFPILLELFLKKNAPAKNKDQLQALHNMGHDIPFVISTMIDAGMDQHWTLFREFLKTNSNIFNRYRNKTLYLERIGSVTIYLEAKELGYVDPYIETTLGNLLRIRRGDAITPKITATLHQMTTIFNSSHIYVDSIVFRRYCRNWYLRTIMAMQYGAQYPATYNYHLKSIEPGPKEMSVNLPKPVLNIPLILFCENQDPEMVTLRAGFETYHQQMVQKYLDLFTDTKYGSDYISKFLLVTRMHARGEVTGASLTQVRHWGMLYKYRYELHNGNYDAPFYRRLANGTPFSVLCELYPLVIEMGALAGEQTIAELTTTDILTPPDRNFGVIGSSGSTGDSNNSNTAGDSNTPNSSTGSVDKSAALTPEQQGEWDAKVKKYCRGIYKLMSKLWWPVYDDDYTTPIYKYMSQQDRSQAMALAFYTQSLEYLQKLRTDLVFMRKRLLNNTYYVQVTVTDVLKVRSS